MKKLALALITVFALSAVAFADDAAAPANAGNMGGAPAANTAAPAAADNAAPAKTEKKAKKTSKKHAHKAKSDTTSTPAAQ
jgi:hypothetical protein